ncbi:GNAT family N-acetyltransferase [Dysgonomonas sp. 216]|uniref:GNAT family N-acetyltransferase n=1 Tax=Dysgonomonas sp. 216 TaxID=2302934 RepID=UPI0013D61E14|nr:GNAT family N-acetyltransferase [Dysgonomonas sp. 216]NDW18247.1 GNAT family N-acetyltransferase [Dysgonomonas sp. 216]
MNKNISIRIATTSDIWEITQLFYNTIQNINIKDYPQDEIDDWASWYADTERWIKAVSEQYFIVAVQNNTIVGFSSLNKDGYLDFMFVHKDFQRKGIAKMLLSAIEEKAISQNNRFIYSEVSITALLFFESQGYKVEKQQLKKSRDKELINYKMIKYI